ncbi:MAG: amidase [Caulobacterales bacterium]|nr:amidase [Caulobacterales bacterium]MCA0372864.1 amidase [Pseudomonadota bacterium]
MDLTRRAAVKYSAALSITLGAQTACAKANNSQLEPRFADAVETARRLKSGELDVEKNLEATIENAQKINPKLNAFVTTTFDEARAIAKTKPQGIFGGLPFAIKDLNDYHKTPTMHGSRAYKDAPSLTQSQFLNQVDKLGIISIGKTQTPEFGLTGTTEPLLTGPARNPWNTNHSTGGSSGGAAALVASGVLKMAHASDGGGSIRIPAACCGLVGLKTTRGRLIRPHMERDPRTDISVQGVLTHTMRDTAIFLAVTEDPNSVLPIMELVTDANKKRLKIGYCIESFNGSHIDDEIKAEVIKTADILKSLGHEIIPFTPKIDAKSIENAFMLLWAAGAASGVDEWAKASGKKPNPEYFEPWTLYLAQTYAKRREEFPKALEVLGNLQKNFKPQFLPNFDILLSPVVATTAPKIGYLSTAIDPELHYARIVEFAPFFTAIMNASGAPAISLPMGQSKSGLPIAIQLASDIGNERALLELGFELEKANPWINRKPQIWAE